MTVDNILRERVLFNRDSRILCSLSIALCISIIISSSICMGYFALHHSNLSNYEFYGIESGLIGAILVASLWIYISHTFLLQRERELENIIDYASSQNHPLTFSRAERFFQTLRLTLNLLIMRRNKKKKLDFPEDSILGRSLNIMKDKDLYLFIGPQRDDKLRDFAKKQGIAGGSFYRVNQIKGFCHAASLLMASQLLAGIDPKNAIKLFPVEGVARRAVLYQAKYKDLYDYGIDMSSNTRERSNKIEEAVANRVNLTYVNCKNVKKGSDAIEDLLSKQEGAFMIGIPVYFAGLITSYHSLLMFKNEESRYFFDINQGLAKDVTKCSLEKVFARYGIKSNRSLDAPIVIKQIRLF